jgi:hypothetical protein
MRFSVLAIVLLAPARAQSGNSNVLNHVLAGPLPNGWLVTHDVSEEANLAIDLGYMYEFEGTAERLNLYTSGLHENQELTLKMLGIRKSRDAIEDPISNYNVNTFNAIGKLDNENDGSFDEEPVYNYANTLIIDLFNVEGQSDPVRGIEKEGALILGAWMRVYEDLYNVLRYCGAPDAHADPEELLQLLDRVAALWIGRLQSYGDNTRGTMLYNLAERTSIHFNQEHGEAEVNTKFLFILNEMKAMVDNGECFDDGSLQTGYHVLYKHFHQIVGVMNIPLIQNLIHYIAFDADPKLIELYVLALMPQLRSCNEDYFDFFHLRGRRVVFR